MMTPVEFSKDHIDALTELMNIGAGHVTAALAKLLNTEGIMHIPKVTLCTLAEMDNFIALNLDQNLPQYASKQLFYGQMSGELLFIIDKNAATSINMKLYDLEVPSETDILDGVGELANIIGSVMLSRLANELVTSISFSAPIIEAMAPQEIHIQDENLRYSQVIIVSTCLEFAHYNMNGFIYILAEDEMIKNLKTLIDAKLEEVGL
jgi:chemotaxis protein CheC